MSEEKKDILIVGPPGCGKTTWLARQIEAAAEKYPPELILACSFTKAAVSELLTRNLSVPEENVGTLHSLCYRALDHPELCETPKGLKEFSEGNPRYAVGAGSREAVDDGHVHSSDNKGDGLLMEYSRLRAIMRPRELWPASVSRFAKEWEGYKQETGSLDFTDLIAVAIEDVERPACYPVVGFLDEAQDLSPLEAALWKKWAATMQKSVVVMDPAQAIYGFKGARPEAMYDEGKVFTTLKQSFRLPGSVKQAAERLIGRSGLVRDYLDRGAEGTISKAPFTYRDTSQIIDEALKHTEQYQTVLVLTSCGYMLSPLLEDLRKQGIPFANPFRRKRRDWNPLHRVRNQVGAAERVAAFQAAFSRDRVEWTLDELTRWLPLTKGVTRRNHKEYMQSLPDDRLLTAHDLMGVIEPDEVDQALVNGLWWLESHLTAQWAKTAGYAIRVGTRTPVALLEEPLLQVGTIHSTKGGEADVVILFPDVSPEGFRELGSKEGRQAAVRQFYVGMTRARDTLIWGAPSGRLAFPWREA